MPTRARALEAFALLAGASSLFGALFAAGLRDPLELEAAELSRRIAYFMSGDPRLGDRAVDVMPTQGELGRGELPFVAIALGFRCFGLSPWAARLPLAWLGAFGVLATYCLVRRLGSRRAAALSALALATAPLYFLNARTLPGEIGTMTACALAFCGFSLCVHDDDLRVRVAGACLGALAAFLGFYARGPLLGVTAPALGVGLCWLSLALAGAPQSRATRTAGALVLGFGLLSAAVGWFALRTIPPAEYSVWVGSSPSTEGAARTFEATLRDLFHGLFPWSALLVPAIAELAGGSGLEPRRAALGASALSALAVAIGLHIALGPRFGAVPFVLPAAVAVLVGLALDELDRDASVPRAFAAATSVVALLLLWDFHRLPDKLLAAIPLRQNAFEQGEPVSGFAAFAVGALAALSVCGAALTAPRARAHVFRGRQYALRLHWARTLYAGRFWYLAVASGAGAIGLDLALSVGALSRPDAELSGLRLFARVAWIAIAAVCLAPAGALLVRDVVRVAMAPGLVLAARPGLARFAELRFGRGASLGVVLALFALGASLAFYPRLLSDPAPDPLLAGYERHARANEPLGVLGDDLRAARYQGRSEVTVLANREQAAKFVAAPAGASRRFLALSIADLAPLNAVFRAQEAPRRNLPVIDFRSRDLILAANVLAPGERDRSPFAEFFSVTPPSPQHALSAELGAKLELAGFSIESLERRRVSSVIAGESYDLVLYFHVLAPLDADWRIFVHLDGFQQRFNADHAPLEGVYPTTLWLRGDWVIDRHRLHVDASLTPATYAAYAGMYRNDVRLPVTRGTAEADRIFLGVLRVD